MTQIIFLDTETTGLDVNLHEAWEYAYVGYRSESDIIDGNPNITRTGFLDADLATADPQALEIGGYFNRYLEPVQGMFDVAKDIMLSLNGAIIIGNNPAFDIGFLKKFTQLHGFTLLPFHRAINVVDMALQQAWKLDTREGREAASLPHNSSALFEAIGCKVARQHTALSDVMDVISVWKKLRYGIDS